MLIWLAYVKASHRVVGPARSHCTSLLSYTARLVVCCTLCRCFSWAISWLFFKWPLSQGMAGQHMETSALTIFLSKQQMALLLSFWSGTQIPKAEVLVYIACLARNCLRVQLASPTVACLQMFALQLSFLVCVFLWLCFCGMSWTLILPPVTVAKATALATVFLTVFSICGSGATHSATKERVACKSKLPANLFGHWILAIYHGWPGEWLSHQGSSNASEPKMAILTLPFNFWLGRA